MVAWSHIAGNGGLMHAGFQPQPPSSGHISMDLGPGTLPRQEMKGPHSLDGFITLCGNSFACCRLFVCSFVLLKCVHYTAPGQHPRHCCLWRGGDEVLLLQHSRGGHRPVALQWSLEGTYCPWGTDSHHGSWSYSPCCVTKAFFYPLLRWAVFSLTTAVPRCSGQKGSDLSYHRYHTSPVWHLCLIGVQNPVWRWLPMVLSSQYSCSCVISSPLVQAGPGNWLLTKKILQEQWQVTAKVRLQKTLASFPLIHSLLAQHRSCSHLTLTEGSCCVVGSLWRLLQGKELIQPQW